MDLEEKIAAFNELGQWLDSFMQRDDPIIREAEKSNPWFTEMFIRTSLQGIRKYMRKENLTRWLSAYDLRGKAGKVGLIMAGNIPMVGFHDLLCLSLSNHHAYIKMSHQDDVLIPWLTNHLFRIDNRFGERIHFTDQIDGMDAIIATGSDNTARYFTNRFRNTPHIIRKNRTSVAILTGRESEDQLRRLAHDIFLYFGLGCRNVSKLYLPEGLSLDYIKNAFNNFEWIADHQKYHHNYNYQRTMMRINRIPHQDAGFFLLEGSPNLVSPISVIYVEHYEDREKLLPLLRMNNERIQCVVTDKPLGDIETVGFGHAQFPDVADYADRVDTMNFLENLNPD